MILFFRQILKHLYFNQNITLNVSIEIRTINVFLQLKIFEYAYFKCIILTKNVFTILITMNVVMYFLLSFNSNVFTKYMTNYTLFKNCFLQQKLDMHICNKNKNKIVFTF